ncbi:MAG TPA: ATP-binding protein [Spirochaetota bacterium]|nr:ATP-binding protein [Spirochaetota bacterium]HNT11197.1 ATP-binding protein [Spirochaetota bacterium]
MTQNAETQLIPFDRMKEQVERAIAAFLERTRSPEAVPAPRIAFEKGSTIIAFPLPFLNEALLASFIGLIKTHLANVRIHAFGDGYYAFQSLGGNLFRTENILDNVKIEFSGLTTSFKAEISKKGGLTQEEVNLAVELYKEAYSAVKDDPIARLRAMGASVYTDNGELTWAYIAGYDEVKKKIRESIILPLTNPEMYNSIARLTRKTFETNRPKAILFEGSPGVGKTTVARILAGEVLVPLVYVPIESIMSKWYGQSSQNLAGIFDAAEDLGGSILFLDEIDALAGSRDQNMFEATRRVLSVLLRKLDGIDSVVSTVTIGATNRKGDLDHALISRFDQSIYFPLPNERERAAILANYAAHLSDEERAGLAGIIDGLSGRTIKDICEMAERRWARRLIVKGMEPSPPPPEHYRQSARTWIEDNRVRD